MTYVFKTTRYQITQPKWPLIPRKNHTSCDLHEHRNPKQQNLKNTSEINRIKIHTTIRFDINDNTTGKFNCHYRTRDT